jgi:drug/metabolite transporter (DMT)-like permease
MVVAWPLQILALGLAPITVVQPTLVSSQLVLLGMAKVKLHERVGWLEAVGALAIVAGAVMVVWAAPRHTALGPQASRVAQPLVVIGVAAVVAYVLARVRPRLEVTLVLGAGLAYAWVDFTNKILAHDISKQHWLPAAMWLGATIGFGALAFLEETTALQRRPAVTVAPVIGAVHGPLPILMALWSGVEVWGTAPHRIGELVVGLVFVTAGAVSLGRSKAVTRISGGGQVAAASRPELASVQRRPSPITQRFSLVAEADA